MCVIVSKPLFYPYNYSMLKKKERLTRTLFDRSFSVGKRIHSGSFQLIVAPSETFHGSIVIGKKIYKKAVDRNKLRRQLYAILYQFHTHTPLTRTYIVIAKPLIVGKKQLELAQELKEALEKGLKS